MKKMRLKRPTISIRRATGWALAALTLALGMSEPARQLSDMPGTIKLTKGNTTSLSFWMPLETEVVDQGAQVISSMDERLNQGGSVVSLTAEEEGNAQLILRLMGLPVKTVNVTVEPTRTIVPGGQSIGVALSMAGVLVVGASDVGSSPSPARKAGLRAGDLIVEVNGKSVASASELTECIASGKATKLLVERAGKQVGVEIVPVKDSRDGAYRLGAWVRDSTAGVGTLSFYEPQSGAFGALGHAITDADTGTLLTVSDGSIYESRIVGVLKGESGEPGELLGEFFDSAAHMGEVRVNGDYGIYGVSDGPIGNALYPDGVSILTRSEVKAGPAKILTTLDDGGIKAYDCEITHLYHQDNASQRGMVVKITDQALLNTTGGIVQGMSGSPILQNGRLAGAVTHVFINDPTQGYGMYIEWMLKQTDALAGDDAA